MEQLKVGIGADTKGLEKGLKDAEKALNGFSSKTGKTVNGLNKTSKAGKALGNQMGSLRKKTADGSSAMVAFSRGIQDAPFGIMGVSNNITNLTEQFGYLKTKTGSATGALKAMIKSAKGFNGITLLISLATTAWLMYSRSQQGAAKATNELVDAQKDLIGGTMQEISSVKTLLSIAKNENESKRKRELAVNKLQELYPKYLSNITLEGINTSKTKESVDLLTKSLIQQAKVKGAQSRLSDLYSKRFEIENKKAAEQVSIMKTLWIGVRNFGNISKSAMDASAVATKNQKKELGKLDEEIGKVNSSITKLLSSDFDFDKMFGGKGESPVKALVSETFMPIIQEFDIFGNKIKESIDNTNAQLQGRGIDWQKAYNAEQQLKEQARIEANLLAMNTRLSDIINNGMINALAGIGVGIGNALATGASVISSVGGVLLGALGNVLTQVGQMAISIGIGLQAIKTALKTLNPLAAIGAGVALVALGSYFSSKSQSIGSSMGSSSGSSGGASSASSAGSGYSAPTSRGGFSNGSGGGTVVFEIAGQKLVGVLSNTLQRNRNLGGTLGITT